jgi:biotin carboxyl carrier protein
MTQPRDDSIAQHVARLARFLLEEDLESVRIEREHETFEVGRTAVELQQTATPEQTEKEAPRIEQIASDRVGIFHFSRPMPFEGERIDGDRELGYVEQLGIRNPVRSRGPGRIRAVLQRDGDLVDYGRPLFELERI